MYMLGFGFWVLGFFGGAVGVILSFLFSFLCLFFATSFLFLGLVYILKFFLSFLFSLPSVFGPDLFHDRFFVSFFFLFSTTQAGGFELINWIGLDIYMREKEFKRAIG